MYAFHACFVKDVCVSDSDTFIHCSFCRCIPHLFCWVGIDIKHWGKTLLFIAGQVLGAESALGIHQGMS